MMKKFLYPLLLLSLVSAEAEVVLFNNAKNAAASTCGAIRSTEYPSGNCPVSGASCSTWTCISIGDATGTIDEVSATELDFTPATGSSETTDDLDLAYQSQATASDMQLTWRNVGGWTGDLQNFTFFGGGFREEIVGDGYRAMMAWPNVTDYRCKSGTGATFPTNATGSTALTLPAYGGITYDHSAGEIQCWESADNISWVAVGSPIAKTITFPAYYYIFGTAHNASAAVVATVDNISYSTTLSLSDTGGSPSRNISWEMAFETGQMQPRNGSSGTEDSGSLSQIITDGTLSITNVTQANPGVLTYSGTDPTSLQGFTVSGVGGMTQLNGYLVRACNLNTTANTFTVCVDNEPLGNGNDQSLGSYNLDTSGFSAYSSGGTLQKWAGHSTGNSGGANDASGYPVRVVPSGTTAIGGDSNVLSRSGSYFLKAEQTYDRPYEVFPGGNNGKNKPRWSINPNTDTQVDWDTECWYGFSIYLPSDFPVEAASSNNASHNFIHTMAGRSPSNDHLHLLTHTPTSDAANTHWMIEYYVSATSVSSGGEVQVDLGAVTRGVWTDFVIRYRGNPFTVSTNASTADPQGQNKVFAGNTGILQAWINVAGNTPSKVIDIDGAPFGLVPQDGELLRVDFRGYKFPWHHQDTNILTPIQYGYDEIRFGCTAVDGTGFSDVHPGQVAQP